MKKRIVITLFFACALIFTFGNDIAMVAAPELFSPMGAGRTPTIPILPPIN
ncbi:hypothetical protein ACFO0S_09035 [Chryseomicrobium palamuruense]|uniref:Uncharacterized protein n=1 Tax=Chryseomicrobium palamuruense TaxID=682973 RepID=A0ABV8UXE6_9BACL